MSTVEWIPQERAEKPYTVLEAERLAMKLGDMLRKRIEDYAVYARNFFTRVRITVGTPFHEISDAVLSMLEKSDVDVDEAFEEAYENMLEEINTDYAVYVTGRIETEKFAITFEPEECREDNCMAGLTAEVEFKQKVTEVDLDKIAELIAVVFRL
jgi:hypothetical protein